eukprot:2810912-Amphidinium_carterae.1
MSWLLPPPNTLRSWPSTFCRILPICGMYMDVCIISRLYDPDIAKDIRDRELHVQRLRKPWISSVPASPRLNPSSDNLVPLAVLEWMCHD